MPFVIYGIAELMKRMPMDDELQSKLRRAARASGMSQSEFVRDALVRRCAEVLGETLDHRLFSVIGVVKSSGGRSANPGEAFGRALRRRGT